MWMKSLDNWLSCYRYTIDIDTLLRYALVMVQIMVQVDVHGLCAWFGTWYGTCVDVHSL
jgi:hypothetical protein